MKSDWVKVVLFVVNSLQTNKYLQTDFAIFCLLNTTLYYIVNNKISGNIAIGFSNTNNTHKIHCIQRLEPVFKLIIIPMLAKHWDIFH